MPSEKDIDGLLASRKNNFNLLRFIAATLVIYSHSYALLPNGLASDPLVKVLGFGCAGIAVNSFFAISGFLIVRSYLLHDNLRMYLQARMFRILPGLIVAVLFCAFVVGTIQTSLPLPSYVDHPNLYRFIYTNIGMYNRLPTLPGVFLENPSAGVNGSLWTLSYEVTMYLSVAVVGVLGLLKRKRGLAALCFAYTAYYLFVTTHPDLAADWISPRSEKYRRLSLYFFLGGCIYVFRRSVKIKGAGAMALWGLVLIAYGGPLFTFLFSVALTYSLFWVAFVPRGRILHFNRLDDYSYGIYIYAFPIQQWIVARHPAVDETRLFVFSFGATLLLAWMSCNWVEKPALKLNKRLAKSFYRQRKKT